MGHTGNEPMRPAPSSILRPCDGNGSLPREHITEEKVARLYSKKALGADFEARERRLMKRALSE